MNEEIENIKQNTKNQKAQEALTKIQQGIEQINLNFSQDTYEDRAKQIQMAAIAITHNVDILEVDRDIKRATENTIIEQTRAALANATIQNELLHTQVKLTVAQAAKIANDITNANIGVLQNWSKIGIDAQNSAINKAWLQWETDPTLKQIGLQTNKHIS